ncbi:unnamed protein product [Peniophora sp. CBMAI 1063]|nr:unnamed protein product [Peniophora sp. CBMAI 1063]
MSLVSNPLLRARNNHAAELARLYDGKTEGEKFRVCTQRTLAALHALRAVQDPETASIGYEMMIEEALKVFSNGVPHPSLQVILDALYKRFGVNAGARKESIASAVATALDGLDGQVWSDVSPWDNEDDSWWSYLVATQATPMIEPTGPFRPPARAAAPAESVESAEAPAPFRGDAVSAPPTYPNFTLANSTRDGLGVTSQDGDNTRPAPSVLAGNTRRLDGGGEDGDAVSSATEASGDDANARRKTIVKGRQKAPAPGRDASGVEKNGVRPKPVNPKRTATATSAGSVSAIIPSLMKNADSGTPTLRAPSLLRRAKLFEDLLEKKKLSAWPQWLDTEGNILDKDFAKASNNYVNEDTTSFFSSAPEIYADHETYIEHHPCYNTRNPNAIRSGTKASKKGSSAANPINADDPMPVTNSDVEPDDDDDDDETDSVKAEQVDHVLAWEGHRSQPESTGQRERKVEAPPKKAPVVGPTTAIPSSDTINVKMLHDTVQLVQNTQLAQKNTLDHLLSEVQRLHQRLDGLGPLYYSNLETAQWSIQDSWFHQPMDGGSSGLNAASTTVSIPPQVTSLEPTPFASIAKPCANVERQPFAASTPFSKRSSGVHPPFGSSMSPVAESGTMPFRHPLPALPNTTTPLLDDAHGLMITGEPSLLLPTPQDTIFAPQLHPINSALPESVAQPVLMAKATVAIPAETSTPSTYPSSSLQMMMGTNDLTAPGMGVQGLAHAAATQEQGQTTPLLPAAEEEDVRMSNTGDSAVRTVGGPNNINSSSPNASGIAPSPFSDPSGMERLTMPLHEGDHAEPMATMHQMLPGNEDTRHRDTLRVHFSLPVIDRGSKYADPDAPTLHPPALQSLSPSGLGKFEMNIADGVQTNNTTGNRDTENTFHTDVIPDQVSDKEDLNDRDVHAWATQTEGLGQERFDEAKESPTSGPLPNMQLIV